MATVISMPQPSQLESTWDSRALEVGLNLLAWEFSTPLGRFWKMLNCARSLDLSKEYKERE